MKNIQKINKITIKFKDNEKAKEDFINLILDYILDNGLLTKEGVNGTK